MIRHQKENTYEISGTQERSQRGKKKHQRNQDCYGNIKKYNSHCRKNRIEKGEQNKMNIPKIFIGLERKGNGRTSVRCMHLPFSHLGKLFL